MAKRLTEAEVRREIAELENQDIKSLQVRWRQVFKVSTPRGIRAPFLRRAIAYRLQEQVHGGLSAGTKRRLCKIAEADLQERQPGSRPRRIKLSPGTQLVREWQGKTVVVEVTRDGYVWRGSPYNTLSAVASAITGTRWSGPRFFGLTAGRQASRGTISKNQGADPAGKLGNCQTGETEAAE